MKNMIVATCMAVIAGSAAAQVSVEAAFGATNLDMDCAGATYCKNNGSGAKLVLGYVVAPNISVEAGYVNFGEAKGRAPYEGYLVDLTLKSSAFYIGGAARGEFGRGFSGVARMGIAQVKTTTDANIGIYSASESDSKANVLFGLALEYALTTKLKATAGIDFTQSPIAEGDTTATLRLISAGLQYNF